MQELSWPRPTEPDAPPVQADAPLEHYPYFAAVMGVVMPKVAEKGLAASYAEEFTCGLELVLDALSPLRAHR